MRSFTWNRLQRYETWGCSQGFPAINNLIRNSTAICNLKARQKALDSLQSMLVWNTVCPVLQESSIRFSEPCFTIWNL